MNPPINPKMAMLATYAADWASKLGMRYQLAVRLASSPLAKSPTIAVRTATPNDEGQDMGAVRGELLDVRPRYHGSDVAYPPRPQHPDPDGKARPHADLNGDYADFADLLRGRDTGAAQRAGILG